MPEPPAPFAEVDLPPLLEAYLFVATEPVQPAEIGRLLGIEAAAVEEALEDMANAYARRINSGLHVVRIAGGYQMATRPQLAEGVARLLAAPGQKSRLSKPALETLAIIAYLHYFGLNTLEDLPPLEDIALAEAEADKAATHNALEAVGLGEE